LVLKARAARNQATQRAHNNYMSYKMPNDIRIKSRGTTMRRR